MPLPTPDEVAETLTDERLRAIRKDAMKASKGQWGVWGMALCSSRDGEMDVDRNTDWLAMFWTTNDEGSPRTWDVNHVVNTQPMTAVALIDEVLRLRSIQPPGTVALAGLHDEDPRREAQAQANRTGRTVAYRDDTGWVEVEPEEFTLDGDTITVHPWLVRAFRRGLRRKGA